MWCRADPLDLDVLVYTNACMEKEAEAEGGPAACAAACRALLARMADPERQRVVVNIDGERIVHVCGWGVGNMKQRWFAARLPLATKPASPASTSPASLPMGADTRGAQLAEQAAAAGATVLTFSSHNRDADIYAEKVKVCVGVGVGEGECGAGADASGLLNWLAGL